MQILVTGTAGFIGNALALRLLERGDSVAGLDNVNAYYDVRLKEDRLARLGPLLDIPGGMTAHALLPIGWPADRIGPVSRRPVHKVTSIDSWGEKWQYALDQPDEGRRAQWTGE